MARLVINRLKFRRRRLPCQTYRDVCTRRAAERDPSRWVTEQPRHRSCQRLRVLLRHEHACFPVTTARPTPATSDANRTTRRERIQKRIRQTIDIAPMVVHRRQQINVACPQAAGADPGPPAPRTGPDLRYQAPLPAPVARRERPVPRDHEAHPGTAPRLPRTPRPRPRNPSYRRAAPRRARVLSPRAGRTRNAPPPVSPVTGLDWSPLTPYGMTRCVSRRAQPTARSRGHRSTPSRRRRIEMPIAPQDPRASVVPRRRHPNHAD